MLQVYKRDVQTNQRIYFDLYKEYLFSGNSDGNVSIWNSLADSTGDEFQPVVSSFKAHNDCVNGISFNPIYPLLATSSGQRKFFSKKNKTTSSDSSSAESDQEENSTSENCLKIWKHYL